MLNRRAGIQQRSADRAKAFFGDLELELFNRLADLSTGVAQCPHQYERSELAKISGGTHRRPEPRLSEGDDAVGDLPARQPLCERLVNRFLDRAVERERQRAQLANVVNAAAASGRLDAEADRRVERIPGHADELGVLARADRALDANGAGWSEGDADAIVPGQRLQNDVFLHLAIEPQRYLPRLVALTQRDKRVLFRELLERRA